MSNPHDAATAMAELRELHARPSGWGTVQWRRADKTSSTERELCDECMSTVLETLNETPRTP